RLQGVNIHTELKKILRNKARFRELQEPILKAIIKHQSPILGVIATGVKKTLLFQLLTKNIHSSTTIIISLLVLLQEHIMKRY
ncbi:hypothetical protein DL95DRAFT_315355, partial [Leptodontidium sp. 2 PMI_412]